MSISLSSLLSRPQPNQKSTSFILRQASQSNVISHCFFRNPDASRSCSVVFSPLKSVNIRDKLRFSPQGRLRFSSRLFNGFGDTGESISEVEEEARGQSTLPARFRHLTKEVPDQPLRWPWLIVLAFLVYTWRTVLWELTNWTKMAMTIFNFLLYVSKLVLAIIFHFIGDPLTALVGYIETSCYFARSIYSNIVGYTPVWELTVIIVLTSMVLSIAQATSPDAVRSQPYLLTSAGLIAYLAVSNTIPEPLFWAFIVGSFCFSHFVKKRDGVSSTLPIAAIFTAVGEPWMRVLVMASYTSIAIIQHSNSPQTPDIVENPMNTPRPPLPLLLTALAIGIHIAAKWVRFRHLTWMIA